jgi:hypothetical protein
MLVRRHISSEESAPFTSPSVPTRTAVTSASCKDRKIPHFFPRFVAGLQSRLLVPSGRLVYSGCHGLGCAVRVRKLTARAISPRSEGTATDSATQQRSALVLTVNPGALLGLILSQVGADWRRRC